MPIPGSLTATSPTSDCILPHHSNGNRIIGHIRTAVRLAVGVLLLIAAGLKLAGQSVSAVPQVGWFATPMVQMAAAEWEFALGIWLLSGRYRLGSWLGSVATFLTFAAISGYLGFVGVASCGCFGTIKASPWYAFALDITALVMLGLSPPDFAPLRQLKFADWGNLSRKSAACVLAVTGFTAILMGAATWAFGSMEAALAKLREERLAVVPTFVDLGIGKQGQKLGAVIQICNWSNRNVRIIGGTSDCSCVVTSGLPVTIPPGESCSLPIQLDVRSNESGTITRVAKFLTDDDQQRFIKLYISFRTK